jgi:hypothetical protein
MTDSVDGSSSRPGDPDPARPRLPADLRPIDARVAMSTTTSRAMLAGPTPRQTDPAGERGRRLSRSSASPAIRYTWPYRANDFAHLPLRPAARLVLLVKSAGSLTVRPVTGAVDRSTPTCRCRTRTYRTSTGIPSGGAGNCDPSRRNPRSRRPGADDRGLYDGRSPPPAHAGNRHPDRDGAKPYDVLRP